MNKNIFKILVLGISAVALFLAILLMPSIDENDTSVLISKNSISFFGVGEVAEISATVVENGVRVDTGENGEQIIWTSSDNGIATVDNGIVTAVGYGSCVIRASCGDASAFCTVSNPNPNPVVSISQTEVFLDNIGSTVDLYLTSAVGDNVSSMASWRTSNASVAVSKNGIVTATGYGSCIITATFNRSAVSCIVTVNNPTAPSVNISKENLHLKIGEAYELQAVMDNNAGSQLTWKSTNPDIAICEDGVVTAKQDGTCAIIAMTELGYADVCIVTSGKGQKPNAHSSYLDFSFPDIGKELRCVDRTTGRTTTTAVVIGYKMETLLLSDGRLVVEISLICAKTYDIDGPEATNPARVTVTLYRENEGFCDKRTYKAQGAAVGEVFSIKCSGFTVQTRTDGVAREFYMAFATVTER